MITLLWVDPDSFIYMGGLHTFFSTWNNSHMEHGCICQLWLADWSSFSWNMLFTLINRWVWLPSIAYILSYENEAMQDMKTCWILSTVLVDVECGIWHKNIMKEKCYSMNMQMKIANSIPFWKIEKHVTCHLWRWSE